MQIFDLFRPKWRQSDAATRLTAVRELDAGETEILTEIACNDEDPAVRQAAAERINDAAILRQIADSGPGPAAMAVVTAKLDRICKAEILAAEDADAALTRLADIVDEDVLLEIAIETSIPAVRLAAVDRVQSATRLGKLAGMNCGKEAGLAIVARVRSEEILTDIAAHGSNNAVRHAAEDKLETMRGPAAPSAEEQRDEELKSLLKHAEDVKDTWNFDAVGKLLEADVARWRELDPEGSHTLAAQFEAALAQFESRRTEFESRQAETKKAQEAQTRLRVQKEELAEKMLEIDPTSENPAGLIAEYEETWDALPALADDALENELRQRFETADQKTTAAVRQAEEDLDTLEELQKLVDRIEAARRQGDVDGMRACLKLEWPKVQADYVDADLLKQRFDAGIKAIRTSIENAEERRQREAEERAGRLQELIKVVSAQCDEENHKKALSRVRTAQKEWKALDGKSDPRINGAFQKALDNFYKQEREYREEREWDEWHNKGVKEELIKQVQACAENNDLPKVAKIIREAQSKWKATGPVPREDADAMWKTFHAACEENYARCKEFFAKQKEERKKHLEIAIELCEKAEAVKDSTHWRDAANELKDLQRQWKEMGALPRQQSKKVYQRFRAACDHFFNRRRDHFAERDQERE